MTTKEQERQAIEKIRKIVEGLGENSYVGFAMEGVLELAEDNIREDTAYSMKKNAEIAWEREDKAEKENKDLKKEVEDLKKTVEKREATISELNTELCNARAEAKANEIPEELVQEMYCMAYDKEAEADGKHQEWANDYLDKNLTQEERFAAMVEINASGMVKSSPDVIGAADYLVRRGWVLLHNPQQGIAIPTRDITREYTKAQKEFLYDYYMERDCKEEANAIWQDE